MMISRGKSAEIWPDITPSLITFSFSLTGSSRFAGGEQINKFNKFTCFGYQLKFNRFRAISWLFYLGFYSMRGSRPSQRLPQPSMITLDNRLLTVQRSFTYDVLRELGLAKIVEALNGEQILVARLQSGYSPFT